MKIAVIDMGTNTFNLLIVEKAADGSFRHLYNTKMVVKLGEGGLNKNNIEPQPFLRGVDAMKQYKITAEKYGVEKIIAFATSAVRSAVNGNEFVARVKSETGIEVNIIDGDKEAELIYYGVRAALDLGDKPVLVMDIGGGSTEFIIADKNKIHWQKSFLLGVSRLQQKIPTSDPVQPNEIIILEQYLERTLQPLVDIVKQYEINELVGSSGSFDSFADMIVHKYYSPGILEGKTEYKFDVGQYHEIAGQLLLSSKKDRLQMKGLVEMRVDMIVVAAVMVNYVLRKFNITAMRLSSYSLKEGALFST